MRKKVVNVWFVCSLLVATTIEFSNYVVEMLLIANLVVSSIATITANSKVNTCSTNVNECSTND